MESTRQPARVWIVEDDPIVTRALSSLLKDAGLETEVFHTALAALNHVVHGAPPAAAVLDIHLPDLNGLVLSRKLRDQWGPQVPILILSGDTSMENLNALAEMGATYFLSKPVNTEHLLERLRDLAGC